MTDLRDLANLVEEADRLVRPFMEIDDSWGHGPEGLPLLQDMAYALRRVTGRPVRIDWSFREQVGEHIVGHRDGREDHTGWSIEEALLGLLVDELRRTCPVCRERDGHESRCPVLAAELAEEEVA